MRNLIVRYLTAIVLLPLILCIIQYAPSLYFDGVIVLVFLLALYEGLQIIRKIHSEIPIVLGMILGCIALSSIIFQTLVESDTIAYTSVMILLVGIWSYTVMTGKRSMVDTAAGAALLFTLVITVCWGGGALIRIREISSLTDPRHIIYLLLGIVWLGDAGAMHVGKWLGRHKLCPVTSPNKTVEGLLGAIVFGWIGGFIAYSIWEFHFHWWHIVVLAPALVLLAHAGDLTASILKRAAGVKDSGFLIPGHGGFLDRLDNLIFTAPFLFVYTAIMWCR
jgi:phosphatidate cytidylyltransferase